MFEKPSADAASHPVQHLTLMSSIQCVLKIFIGCFDICGCDQKRRLSKRQHTEQEQSRVIR